MPYLALTYAPIEATAGASKDTGRPKKSESLFDAQPVMMRGTYRP